ncbi:probable malonyl-CoA-acyl carrier protein transacylase, mitochondrial isoform X2 [Sycon ciliatum]|uniref:probable malonyl-CoA-acyl carrier protein transacylase, mitochondrial isoform X2 n=1 Tax=Sycon ciliatum TaxID=27933 RepID=UPI0031F6168E
MLSCLGRKLRVNSLSCSLVRNRSCNTQGLESVFLFPGQGSQEVGMCRESLRESSVREMFDEASEVLGYDLARVCMDGPADELNRTAVCQPAAVVASLTAAWKYSLQNGGPSWPSLRVAGFSVGEITSLIYTKSISFKAGMQLIQARGRAMQDASDRFPGAILSVRGLKHVDVIDLCRRCKEETRLESIAPCNSPDSLYLGISSFLAREAFTVAGHSQLVDMAEGCAADMGAFHTPLMASAQEAVRSVLDSVVVSMPRCPVYSNVTGLPFTCPDDIRQRLVEQLVLPVLWSAIVADLLAAASTSTRYIELGPGRSLTASLVLNKRALSRRCVNIHAN